MNEHSFAQKLKRLSLKANPELHWWKINDQFAGGVPDIYIEGEKGELWVELKFRKELPKRPTTLITVKDSLSTLQQLWLTRRENRFQDTLVILGMDEGCILFPGKNWSYSLSQKDAVKLTIPHQQAVEYILSRLDE